jgi:hypothetical protein
MCIWQHEMVMGEVHFECLKNYVHLATRNGDGRSAFRVFEKLCASGNTKW